MVGFSFQALLVDPPWRQTQAESEGEESQGKGWAGSDASDGSDGSDGSGRSGRSPAVAKTSDKAGTAVRFVSVQLWHGSATLSGTAVPRQNSFAGFLQTLRRRRSPQDRQDAETVETVKTWRAKIWTAKVALVLLPGALVQRRVKRVKRVRRVRRVVTSCSFEI